MLRTENRLSALIQKAKRSHAPAELRLRGDDLVVVVFPKRDYDRLRGFRKLERFLAPRLRKSLQTHLKETRDTLNRFEKKYGMTSAEFYRRFQAGELNETEDFFDWRVEYGSFCRMKKRVANGKRQTA